MLEAASYAAELEAERGLLFPCGWCGKKYASKEELQLYEGGKELGCPGTDFGWCRVLEGSRKRRRKRLGDD